MFSDIILNENETYEHLFGVNENTEPEDKSLEDILHDKQDDIDESCSNKEESCNESVISLPGTSHDYTIEASYEDYLADKIYNEQRLNMIISKQLILSESTGIAVKTAKLTSLYEAKLGDNIKNGWQKFLNFIKNTAGKFMEAMTKLLLDEKGYLEKYKDIILKKRPKDIDYSYTGDYQLGTQRITTVELPIFNYESYKNELSQESDGPLVQKLVKDFKYNDADSLADQLKEYFLGGGDQKEGKFESLNFQTMYNFCYDFKKIKDVVDKDINHLESSTQAINQAIQNKIKDNTAEAKQEVNKPTDQTSSNNKTEDDTSSSNSNLKMKESALLEAEDEENKGLQIDTSKISQASGSYENRDSVNTDDDSVKSDINKASTESSENIDKMINKWIRVCRTIITAKWTASQQIAKDYMTIIRTHVRSYVGTKDDKADNRGSKQTGDTYKKDGQKQQTEEQK